MLAGVREARERDGEGRAMSQSPEMFHVEHFDPFIDRPSGKPVFSPISPARFVVSGN